MLENELLKMFEYLFVLHIQTKKKKNKNKNCQWNVDEDLIKVNPTYFVIF
jgi:transposase-like protein